MTEKKMIGEYELNKIYCEDCLEGMEKLPDNSIDLIITDPPYGDNIGYGRSNKEILNNEDETINYKMLDICYLKLKNDSNLYLFTNWKFVEKIRKYIIDKTNFTIRMMLVIVKNNFGMGYGFRNQYELCLVLEKGKVSYNLNNFSNVIFMEHINHNGNTHPHQKGIEIIKKMLKHSSKENDIVLDCFMGSGTTAVACKELERNFIGFELSEEYCQIANKRLSQSNLNSFFNNDNKTLQNI